MGLADFLLKIKTISQNIASTLEAHSLKEQPKCLKNVKMHEYQLYGLNWLIALFKEKCNSILGDEMGLGKTLQSISLLAWLHETKQTSGPFLVIAPLSTIENWKEELHRFTPHFKVVKFIGDQQTREALRESFLTKKKKQKKSSSLSSSDGNGSAEEVEQFNVLLTSYEMVIREEEVLRKFSWKCLIFDEAHRLKNHEAQLYTTLMQFRIEHKILLTGTPLQNNLDELWSLLHFIAPKLFDSLDQFRDFFSSVADLRLVVPNKEHSKEANARDRAVSDLQTVLRPFLLRRMKSEVATGLVPKKSEAVLYCPLTAMQKKYYRYVITKDADKLAEATASKNSLLNIVMQLRKCCNHPYLFDGAEPLFDGEFILGDHIVQNSGKMEILDRLLPRLKKEGHKVLLFSQMTRMLDIVQDYLHFRGYTYERLDGSVRGEERYLAIQKFNADQETFVFLLSTRAGGQGLNLAAADTVIFFDSDWNPQRDLQAEARAHRIGQTKNVRVIRLVARHTVEELVLKRAVRKLRLTHAVIESGAFSLATQEDVAASSAAASREELLSAIKFGLSEAADESKEKKGEFVLSDADLDLLLARDGDQSDEQERKKVAVENKQKKTKTEKEVIAQEPAKPKKALQRSNTHIERLTEADEPEAEDVYELYKPELQAADSAALDSIIAQAATVSLQSVSKKRDEQQIALRKQRALLSAKEAAEIRAQKKLDKKLAKWKVNGYVSTALPDVVEEEEEVEEEAAEGEAEAKPLMRKRSSLLALSGQMPVLSTLDDGEDTEEISDATELLLSRDDRAAVHFVVGDVTKPQRTETRGPAIIVNTVDDSGSWSKGGVFAALSNLSPEPEQMYSRAADMDDVPLGAVHVCAVNAEKSHYVALIVAQKRNKKGHVSGIMNEALATGFEKLAQYALKLNASVHVPRIGARTPNFNWYATERLIRQHFVARGVPAYIYYYPRGGDGGGSGKTVSPAKTVSAFPSPAAAAAVKKRAPPTLVSDDEILEEEPPKRPKAEPKSQTAPAQLKTQKSSAKRDLADDSLKLPDTFEGVTAFLYNLGDEHNMIKRQIVGFGGEISSAISSKTTHIISGISQLDEELQKMLFEADQPNIPVVNAMWVRLSVEKGALVDPSDTRVKIRS